VDLSHGSTLRELYVSRRSRHLSPLRPAAHTIRITRRRHVISQRKESTHVQRASAVCRPIMRVERRPWGWVCFGATQAFQVPLVGTQQVPALETTGMGMAELTYDPATRVVTWAIT